MKKKNELMLVEEFLNVINKGHNTSSVAQNIVNWILDEKEEEDF